MKRVAALLVMTVVLSGCDDGNDPPSDLSDEFTSKCDEHGNRVYMTEDDKNAAPSIFVVAGDCEGAS